MKETKLSMPDPQVVVDINEVKDHEEHDRTWLVEGFEQGEPRTWVRTDTYEEAMKQAQKAIYYCEDEVRISSFSYAPEFRELYTVLKANFPWLNR